MDSPATIPPLLSLPAELIHQILTYLPPLSLIDIALTCRRLHQHAYDDALWHPHVNANLPGNLLHTPHPSPSFRAIYGTHHPYWFLTRHKLWFGDSLHTGKLLIARYSPARQAIEAHALVAERGNHTFDFWAADPDVIIHTFHPRVQLDLNQPVLKLEALPTSPPSSPSSGAGDEQQPQRRNRLQLERPMHTLHTNSASAGLFSTFQLARALDPSLVSPGTRVWPPLIIPNAARTRNDSVSLYRSSGHRPSTLAEVSEQHFRLRRWMEFTSARLGAGGGGGGVAAQGVSMRVGEDVTTFATLPEELYRPTGRRPWRGVWCGDYSGHGCEFLVVLQPEKAEEGPLPEKARGVVERMRRRRGSGSGSSTDSWETASTSVVEGEEEGLWEGEYEGVEDGESGGRFESSGESEAPAVDEDEDDVYSGRLEAIKLTGDPNVPRGEYTFIAPDIGKDGLVRVAHESIFRGARIVRSVGHIAARGFIEDGYTPSQLIMISHDKLAQYWEAFGHISFYQRVDIDQFLKAD